MHTVLLALCCDKCRPMAYGRHSGLVVECQTPEQEIRGLILTQVAVLFPWARYIYLPKSTGNTQEVVSETEKLLTHWDVKP